MSVKNIKDFKNHLIGELGVELWRRSDSESMNSIFIFGRINRDTYNNMNLSLRENSIDPYFQLDKTSREVNVFFLNKILSRIKIIHTDIINIINNPKEYCLFEEDSPDYNQDIEKRDKEIIEKLSTIDKCFKELEQHIQEGLTHIPPEKQIEKNQFYIIEKRKLLDIVNRCIDRYNSIIEEIRNRDYHNMHTLYNMKIYPEIVLKSIKLGECDYGSLIEALEPKVPSEKDNKTIVDWLRR